eukprot:SAG31_NODE_8125_length_1517_cov_0.908322_3_plen_53_part_01
MDHVVNDNPGTSFPSQAMLIFNILRHWNTPALVASLGHRYIVKAKRMDLLAIK